MKIQKSYKTGRDFNITKIYSKSSLFLRCFKETIHCLLPISSYCHKGVKQGKKDSYPETQKKYNMQRQKVHREAQCTSQGQCQRALPDWAGLQTKEKLPRRMARRRRNISSSEAPASCSITKPPKDCGDVDPNRSKKPDWVPLASVQANIYFNLMAARFLSPLRMKN